MAHNLFAPRTDLIDKNDNEYAIDDITSSKRNRAPDVDEEQGRNGKYGCDPKIVVVELCMLYYALCESVNVLAHLTFLKRATARPSRYIYN